MGSMSHRADEGAGWLRNRVDGPHPLIEFGRTEPALDARALAGLDRSANLQFLQTQVEQLAERLLKRQREIERRERELAVRLLAWEQRIREDRRGRPDEARPDQAARDRLSAASRMGLDLEHLDAAAPWDGTSRPASWGES